MAAAGAALLIAAPAAAAQTGFVKPLGWYPEEAELRAAVPTSVEFDDVAAANGAVVAVGHDAATGAPAIYSRTEAGWQQAPTEPPLPAAGRLSDVALAGSGASGWAVGTAAGQPLVLELADGVWRDRSAALPAAPTSVAADGNGAVIGDAHGGIHRIATGGTATKSDQLLAAGGINGIALFSGSSGLAVANYEEHAGLPRDSVRIYDLGDPPLLDADERAQATETNMTGVAAVSPQSAFATDSWNITWRLTRAFGGNDWIQEQAPPVADGELPALAAVAAVGGGPPPFDGTGWATEFVAGDAGPAAGALWHRTRWTTDSASWQRAALPAGTPALSGVAATAWDDAWAVGAAGTILRYWRPPDPEAEQAAREAEQQQSTQQQQTTESTTTSQQVQTAEEEPTTGSVVLRWRPSGSAPSDPEGSRFLTNGVVIKDGRERSRKRRRLVKNVRAAFRRNRRGRSKLVVRFRLTRRARIRVAAKRGRKMVGKTRARTLRRGRRKIVFRVSGRKPPTKLKLVARRAPKASKTSNRTQSRRTQ